MKIYFLFFEKFFLMNFIIEILSKFPNCNILTMLVTELKFWKGKVQIKERFYCFITCLRNLRKVLPSQLLIILKNQQCFDVSN